MHKEAQIVDAYVWTTDTLPGRLRVKQQSFGKIKVKNNNNNLLALLFYQVRCGKYKMSNERSW